MTGQAMLFLALVWAIIAANTGYCFFKLMTSERKLDDDRG